MSGAWLRKHADLQRIVADLVGPIKALAALHGYDEPQENSEIEQLGHALRVGDIALGVLAGMTPLSKDEREALMRVGRGIHDYFVMSEQAGVHLVRGEDGIWRFLLTSETAMEDNLVRRGLLIVDNPPSMSTLAAIGHPGRTRVATVWRLTELGKCVLEAWGRT